MTPRCPNCGEPIEKHPDDGCVLAAFIQVLRDRGDHNEEKLVKLHQDCNVDALWNTLGPIIDDIGRGDYSYHE